LLLARLMLRGANLLLMDEPTNDLDHDTLGVLEETLLAHKGCALISSHDRRFLDRVATDILVMGPHGTCELFPGNHAMYQALLQQRQAREAITRAKEPAVAEPTPATTEKRLYKPKLSYKEQRELEGMEAAIAQAESELQGIQATLNHPDFFRTQGPNAASTIRALESAQAEVSRLYQRWEQLEEKAT
jgi:ATP-binding cassette subfamily F protein uup